MSLRLMFVTTVIAMNLSQGAFGSGDDDLNVRAALLERPEIARQRYQGRQREAQESAVRSQVITREEVEAAARSLEAKKAARERNKAQRAAQLREHRRDMERLRQELAGLEFEGETAPAPQTESHENRESRIVSLAETALRIITKITDADKLTPQQIRQILGELAPLSAEEAPLLKKSLPQRPQSK